MMIADISGLWFGNNIVEYNNKDCIGNNQWIVGILSSCGWLHHNEYNKYCIGNVEWIVGILSGCGW
jgi:hypothetical protein